MTGEGGDDLDLIEQAAFVAGERAQAMRGAGLSTTTKSDGTPVTDADMEVDRVLRATLLEARPDYGWLSEETADDPARLGRRRLFVVDPIDGTRAFVRGRPWWVISIAVVEDGRPIAAAVRAPDLAETYLAAEGGGTSLNGAAIHPSTAAVVAGSSILADRQMLAHPEWPEPWPPMRVESRNSIAYRMCLVACGAFDATLALNTKSEWDLAAADLIAREAGAVVTDHKGRALRFNQPVPQAPSLVCAGPALHRLILARTAPIDLRHATETE
jgi:myo-inositol-1(or 4)-monophosphatase